jgi:hypothetical protein
MGCSRQLKGGCPTALRCPLPGRIPPDQRWNPQTKGVPDDASRFSEEPTGGSSRLKKWQHGRRSVNQLISAAQVFTHLRAGSQKRAGAREERNPVGRPPPKQERTMIQTKKALKPGWHTLVQAGLALARSRAGRFYRMEFDSLQACRQAQWECGRRSVDHRISAAQVFTFLSPRGRQKA